MDSTDAWNEHWRQDAQKMLLSATTNPECLRALVEIGGGNAWLVDAVQHYTGEHQHMDIILQEKWSSLLSHPSLLDLQTKQLWLGHRLEQAVSAAGGISF
eukprot:SAG22_NODE_1145_length_5374_cov_15.659526_5_plen_100_part_00